MTQCSPLHEAGYLTQVNEILIRLIEDKTAFSCFLHFGSFGSKICMKNYKIKLDFNNFQYVIYYMTTFIDLPKKFKQANLCVFIVDWAIRSKLRSYSLLYVVD